ncbi:MAG: ASKHA domain-containing protein [Lentisphaeria bacterium]|jgi:uncharacterized 2Fe-2S/4Fe-4S cluster protein (DUF4445 family)
MNISISHCGLPLTQAVALPKPYSWDLRCAGRGTCGRCRVTLLAGRYRVAGKELDVTAPTSALACQTTLLSDKGLIDVPNSALCIPNGQIHALWDGPSLPKHDECVIAVDLGTTTVAAVKIRKGEIIASASCYNQQSRFGDNVISRISQAAAPATLAAMQQAAVASINSLLAELAADDAQRLAIAGNTVMTTILWGIDPTPIGVMPFTPPLRVFPQRRADELGIALPDKTPILALPAIAGYVGGDLTAGIHECRLAPFEMLIDVGTNCEIVLRTNDGLFCTAAAAGPAFEGAAIPSGSRAIPGAIDHVNPDWSYSVIGGGKPSGLCGSAMVDILYAGRQAGWLNACGRLQAELLGKRYRRDGNLQLVDIAPGVALSEADIEQLLKAKAAVYAGIQSLLEYCRCPVEQLQRLILAGGFARYLNLEHAVAIAMLPHAKTQVVGNTSLAGAARLAVEPGIMDELLAIIAQPEDVPLNNIASFEENYIDALFLP